MKYYKVRPEYDGRRVYRRNKNGYYEVVFELVQNELFTPAEMARYILDRRVDGTRNNMEAFEAVEISRRKIHWFFGARFED